MSWLSRLFGRAAPATDIKITFGPNVVPKLLALQMLLGDSDPAKTVGHALAVLDAIVHAHRNGYTTVLMRNSEGVEISLDLKKLFP